MKSIVEKEINAGYIYLSYELPVRTVEFGDAYLVDICSDGTVSGVEVLDLTCGDFDASSFSEIFNTPLEQAESIKTKILALKEAGQ